MRAKTTALLKYWMDSLVDSENSTGQHKKKFFELSCNSRYCVYHRFEKKHFESGKLEDDSLNKWRDTLKKRGKDREDVFITPYIWENIHAEDNETSQDNKKDKKKPDIITPLVYPCKIDIDGNMTPSCLPFIPNNLLFPYGNNDFCIGCFEEYEGEIAGTDKPKDWKDFIHKGINILNYSTASISVDAMLKNNGYIKHDFPFFVDASRSLNCSAHVHSLYKHILESEKELELPLLEALCSGIRHHRASPSNMETFSSRCGHSSTYPLSEEQRSAVGALTCLNQGETLVVNGPPGTGKTTLIFSMIANELVSSVFRKESFPPLIAVVTKNNPAIDHIVDEFNKNLLEDDILCQRWVQGIEGIGYRTPHAGTATNPADVFINALTSDSRGEAEEFLCRKGNLYFDNCKSHKDVMRFTYEEIKKLKTLLEQCSTLLFYRNSLIKKEDEYIKTHRLNEEQNICNGSCRKNDETPSILLDKNFVKNLFLAVKDKCKTAVKEQCSAQYDALNKGIFFKKLHDCELEIIRILTMSGCTCSIPFDLKKIEDLIDIHIRRKLFWLALHYWEAKLFDKDTPIEEWNEGLATEWHHKAMLNPFIASTLQSFPKNFPPLYNTIDLLIIDEAGQVTPEIAAAAFALAKRAVVIGDAKQIEPIYAIQKHIDSKNIAQHELLCAELEESGQTVSTGSLMKMAQAVTPFSRYESRNQDIGNGLFLTEHHRSIDGVIEYCNNLCYGGILVPLRKEPGRLPGFSPLTGIHIQGNCVQTRMSRANKIEAEFIGSWLKKNKDLICKLYGEPLSNCIGIITPYRPQKAILEEALKHNEIEDEILVDTIHSFQGTERPIILFSPVNMKKEDNKEYFIFFNGSPNMLNVAVSRARDHFIVIGDMRLPLYLDPKSPYGLLGRMLDISSPPESIDQGVHMLVTAEEHDAFLREALSKAKHNFILSSPWIVSDVVEKFVDDFKKCADRGVKVSIVADKSKIEPKHEKSISQLESVGVTVHFPLKPVHAKLLFQDDCLAACGSFNWLSAHRIHDEYKQIEKTITYRPKSALDEIRDFYGQCEIPLDNLPDSL